MFSSTEISAKEVYESAYQNALAENQQSMYNWVKYRDELKTTQGLVQTLPDKLSHRVMVPLTSKAMIPGKIVHTNEFLVGLGANYLVKKTGKQTNEYCDRRIKDCDDMLSKLETELQFLQTKLQGPDMNDAFGSEERPEISEHVTEEEDQAWREEHRRKVKEHHEKLSELRKVERRVENEQDLWDRLEQLELEEELEDELNRLHQDGYEEDEDEEEEDEDEDEESTGEPETQEKVLKKSVIFLDDNTESSEALDPLVLHFQHSNTTTSNQGTELTPADIYPRFLKNSRKAEPVSILKVKTNPHETRERAAAAAVNFEKSEEVKNPERTHFEIADVRERNVSSTVVQETTKLDNRRVSKFKASRLK